MDIPESSNSSVGSGVYQRRSTNDLVLQNVTSTLYFNQNGSTYDDFGNYTCEVTIEQAPETSSETVKVVCKYIEYSKLFYFPIILIVKIPRSIWKKCPCLVPQLYHPKFLSHQVCPVIARILTSWKPVSIIYSNHLLQDLSSECDVNI
jgi:hypothetical protein